MMTAIEARRRILMASDNFLPPAYQRVDYLQTSGYDAKFDTGVPGNDESLVFDFDYATITRQSYGSIFGNYGGENSQCWRLLNPSGTGDTRTYIATLMNRRAGASSSLSVVPEGDSIVGRRVNFQMAYGTITTRCGDFINTISPADAAGDFISATTIIIGAPTRTATGNTLVGRFWHFKIWSHGILIRNYIPAIRKSDNKAGFYDTVNHTFNPSIGSADFIAGNDNDVD